MCVTSWEMQRKKTRQIMLGNLPIGGGAPISVQSMTNTQTSDFKATIRQIRRLEEVGCDIVRVAVPDFDAISPLERIVRGTSLPVVADIHFDHRLAIASLSTGVAGIRINPGTLGGRRNLIRVAKESAMAGVAVRVGVNSGSLERRYRGSDSHPEAEVLVNSALEAVKVLEECGVENIKVSVKASDVPRTIEAYCLVSRKTDWPLHVGVTEAGTLFSGTIKSAVGIGALLAMGIGDTIRVSLTASPVEEVRVGKKILASLGLRQEGVDVVSCPTCARAEIDVIKMAKLVERHLENVSANVKVAVMGCAVNGPGEAKDADIGVAGVKGGAVIFKKGKVVRRVPPAEVLGQLMEEIDLLLAES